MAAYREAVHLLGPESQDLHGVHEGAYAEARRRLRNALRALGREDEDVVVDLNSASPQRPTIDLNRPQKSNPNGAGRQRR